MKMVEQLRRRDIVRTGVVAFLATMFCAGAAAAFSSFPPTDHVGIDWPVKPPPRQTCASVCHLGGGGLGTITLSGLPPMWEPGRRYSLLIELLDPQALKFGFEVTAITASFASAGRIIRTDLLGTALLTDLDRGVPYLLHTGSGTDCNLCPGQNGHRWTFDWEAPTGPAGEVAFYLCGNGADGDDSVRGDHVYCEVVRVPELSCSPPLTAIDGLIGVDDLADIVWSWVPTPLATLGYRLYAVAVASDIPVANQSTPAALRICPAPTAADSGCREAGAAGGGPLWFYQLVGVCSAGLEGPN